MANYRKREIARYYESDEPEKGNKGKERHGDIMERSKEGVYKPNGSRKRPT